MDQKIVEKYERNRWNVRLWFTIILAVCAISMTPNLLGVELFPEFPKLWGSIALLILIFTMVRYYDKYNKKIKNDPELDRALNSEMYKLYDYKAIKVAYRTLLVVICVGYFTMRPIGLLVEIPPRALCFIFVICAGMTYQVAWLVYNK